MDTVHNISQRLAGAAEDYNFYISVGDFNMAEFSRQRWVYLNSLFEGAKHVA